MSRSPLPSSLYLSFTFERQTECVVSRTSASPEIKNVNRLYCLSLVCFSWNLFAQANVPSPSSQFLASPQLQLRSVDFEAGRFDAAFLERKPDLRWGLPPSGDSVLSSEPRTNSDSNVSFETTSSNASLNGFTLQMYERLDSGGYLTRPELPSDSRLDRFGNAFEPEIIHFRKV